MTQLQEALEELGVRAVEVRRVSASYLGELVVVEAACAADDFTVRWEGAVLAKRGNAVIYAWLDGGAWRAIYTQPTCL